LLSSAGGIEQSCGVVPLQIYGFQDLKTTQQFYILLISSFCHFPLMLFQIFSSCPKGPNQVLPCLRLLSQNLISFKEQLGAIKSVLNFLYYKLYKCLINSHPLCQDWEHLLLKVNSSWCSLIAIHAFWIPPRTSLQISSSPHLYSSHSFISFALACKYVHVSFTLKSKANETQ
jgi:hypothetical protein